MLLPFPSSSPSHNAGNSLTAFLSTFCTGIPCLYSCWVLPAIINAEPLCNSSLVFAFDLCIRYPQGRPLKGLVCINVPNVDIDPHLVLKVEVAGYAKG